MVICAAIKIEDKIICGYRHSDCYEILHELNPELSKKAYKPDMVIEGFLATDNRFLDRYEAFNEARMCHQLSRANLLYKIEHNENSTLYSEDLY